MAQEKQFTDYELPKVTKMLASMRVARIDAALEGEK